MTNNDILRRIRYTFDFNDKKMIKVFGLAGREVSREQVSNWLKQDDDPDFEALGDLLLATFLNGLIVETRGEREGPQPEPEPNLTHNIIFRKLKIALNLQAEDILEILKLAESRISKHELSAFFRKPGHKHYRECQEQILRKFLKGVQLKYRSKSIAKVAEPASGGNVWKGKGSSAAKPATRPKVALKHKPKSKPKTKLSLKKR